MSLGDRVPAALKVLVPLAAGVAFAAAIALGGSGGSPGPQPQTVAQTPLATSTRAPEGTPTATPTPGVQGTPTSPAGTASATSTAASGATSSPAAASTPSPAPTPAPAGVKGRAEDCPAGWQFFDNTEVKYTLCFPPGWGFHDGTTTGPLAAPERLRGVYIYSDARFPYPAGQKLTEAPVSVRSRVEHALQFTIEAIPGDAKFDGCTATTPILIANRSATICEDRFTVARGEAIFRPDGDIHQIKIFVPFSWTPATPFPGERLDNYVLHVRIVFRTEEAVQFRPVISAILISIRVY